MNFTNKKFSYHDNARYFNPIRRAILKYKMIVPNQKIALGMSGGKDSTALLFFLNELKQRQRLGFDFDIVPIVLDMGNKVDLTPLQRYVKELGFSLEIIPTKIAPIVFEYRKERSPCSLCAKLRRGILYSKAHELGCFSVALGHHADDALETYLMNFLFHGKFASFKPKIFLSKTQINLIRPMIYLPEREIIRFVKRFDLPVIFNPCPANKHTKREEIKQLINKLALSYPKIRTKFLQAMEKESEMWTDKNSE